MSGACGQLCLLLCHLLVNCISKAISTAWVHPQVRTPALPGQVHLLSMRAPSSEGSLEQLPGSDTAVLACTRMVSKGSRCRRGVATTARRQETHCHLGWSHPESKRRSPVSV